MEFNIWSFFLDNLEAAGKIGGYVSLSIIGFALISFVTKKRYDDVASQIGPRWTHPIIGSFLGAIPGCGATIVVASLYKNKKISFGGLFAAFISTLGEGSFVLLGASDEANVAGNLKAYAIITIFGLIAGIIFGYLSNIFEFRYEYVNNQENKKADKISLTKQNTLASIFVEKIGFYAIIAMAVFLAPSSIMAFWGGKIDIISSLTFWVLVALTTTCIIFYFTSIFLYKNHDCFSDMNDIKSTMSHATLDVAMVVTYVFVGLFVANYIIDELVGEETFETWMSSSAHIVVLLAALIGLMPGCGGMIVVATTFIKVNSASIDISKEADKLTDPLELIGDVALTVPPDAIFPMAALIAAAIATSGDGIFPLFADNRKDGLIVSGLGLLVALVVGYTALALGF